MPDLRQGMLRPPTRLRPACTVCGAVVHAAPASTLPRAEAYPVCTALACRLVVGRRAQLDDSSFRRFLQTQLRLRRDVAALVQRNEAQRAADQRRHEAVWAAMRAHLGRPASAGEVAVVVPSGPRQCVRLAQRRVANYRRHLQGLLEEIAATPADAAPAQPEVAPASALGGPLCRLCGGGCCTRGEDSAYLSAATLRRFMALRPQFGPAEVLAAYLERMAPRTERHSCINHTAQGCGLPREMRSEVCNNFSCAALDAVQAPPAAAVPVQSVIAIRRRLGQWTRPTHGADNEITALALITQSGLQPLPLRLAAPG